jgi:hypothetical protein
MFPLIEQEKGGSLITNFLLKDRKRNEVKIVNLSDNERS